MLELVPITDTIGTEVRNIDVTAPISDADFSCVYDAWLSTTILLFRDQSMTPAQHVAFAKRFGEAVSYTRSRFSEPDHPEILVLSNLTREGTLIGTPASGRVWHTDGHYLAQPPAGSMMYAIEVPRRGGDTWFANMSAAYEALPARAREMAEGLRVIISRVQSRPYNYPERPPPTAKERAAWLDVPQPLIRTHEVTGRKSIYAGGNVPWRIEGMPEHRSAPLVTFLQEFSVQPTFTYRHRWRPGDIILWDNRAAMHRATPYDEHDDRRLMHRVTIASKGESAE